VSRDYEDLHGVYAFAGVAEPGSDGAGSKARVNAAA
jgi:hypothetical protein